MEYILMILLVIGILIFWIIKTQNYLASLEANNIKAMSQIGVQISSQWEVLNTLLFVIRNHSVQGYEEIVEIMAARRCITKESLPYDIRIQEDSIAQALEKIKGVAEDSPDLRSQEAYIKGIDAMNQYKKMMETSKLIYDDSVRNFNRKIHKFHAALIAKILGFSNREYIDYNK